MKKVLFGTTTLVAAGLVAGTASAADPISLSIGGKMEQYFGGVGLFDNGGTSDDGGFGINTDTEVYFSGSTTLDNGITVSAMIQLESQTSNTTNADEQYVTLSGGFGRIQAGQKDDVSTQLSVVAPTVGSVSINDLYGWLGSPASGNFAGGDTTWSSDDATVSYFTPSIYGFTAAVSYTPTPGGALVPTAGTTNRDQFDLALGFDNEFGGVSIAADVGGRVYGDSDAYGIRGGLNLGYAGFTVGGAVLTWGGDDNAADGTTVWDAGLSYEVGPYAVGFTYGQNSGGGSITGDQAAYKLGASYNMGPGIDLVGNVFYAEAKPDAGSDREGAGAIGGVVLSF